jgi:hypothetical protein
VRDSFVVERQSEKDDRVKFAINAWQRAIDSGKKWILRLEDDVLVNRYLLHNVCSWRSPHVEPKFGLGFLSVPGLVLTDRARIAYGEKLRTPFRNWPEMHFGGGMLIRAEVLKPVLDQYEACLSLGKSLRNSCCLSKVLYAKGLRSYFHLPSIVRINLALPRGSDGKVIPESVFGTQPYEEKFRRK